MVKAEHLLLIEALGNHTYARDWVFRSCALDSHDIAGTLGFGGNPDRRRPLG